ncbi:MAG TPA: alpha/beta hydrolase [Bryobacteraceae bacterium]|nr:alpha/beta hydrolase [Bryobacteraceae bacterium]
MSTYVLVHGAWHGSWCWKRVRKALQARGHEVFTPTLTGIAERSHLLSPPVDLETHVADVINLIRWEELSDVVLCGHSYGGCVISGVADRIPDRIASLVYLDAFVLENGQSLHDTLPAAMNQAQIEGARQVGDGWKVPPIPAGVFSVNAEDRDWVDRQCTMQPLATFQQKLRLTGAINRIANVTFILASGWGPSPFPPFYEQAKAKGWNTLTLECGHDVILDMPEALTQELLAISSRSAASAD